MVVDGLRANDTTRRSPQQAHDEAVGGVGSADGGAASLTLYGVADNCRAWKRSLQ